MAKRTYEFDILAKIDQAIAAVDRLAESSNKKLSSISFASGFSAFVDGFRLIEDAASKAFDVVKDLTSKAIDQALEAEVAEKKLANALRITGDFSQAAIEDFNNLAKAIESTTKFSAEAVKASVAVAKQYRLTNDETKRAIEVAADLAAVQGTDLDTAVNKVAQTFNGFVDKGLAKTIPGLKNLTKESLIAGDALAIIGQRVAGSAAALGNDFAGSTFRATQALNNIFETFGKLITQNPVIIQGINEIGRGLRELNADLEKNGASLQILVTEGFLALVDAAPAVISVIQKIVTGLTQMAIVASDSATAMIAFGKAVVLGPAAAAADFAKLVDQVSTLSARLNAVQQGSDAFFGPVIKRATETAERIREAAKSAQDLKKNLASAGSTTGISVRIADAFNPEELKKRIEEASKDPIKKSIEFAFSATAKFNDRDGIAIGAGIVNQILKGADGAKKVIADTFGGVADLLLPGIGGVVSEIIGVFSQGPEKTKEFINGFVKAVPQIITAIIQSIPVLIDALVKGVPQIIQGIVEELPTIVESLAEQMPFVGIKLAAEMPAIAVKLVSSIVQNIPQIVRSFIDGLIQGASEFVNAIIDAINPVGENGPLSGIPIIGDIASGIGDVIGGIGDFLGFAEGGRVPDLPQFRGDRFPAKLDAGEQVLSRDLSSKLESALNNGGGVGGGPQNLTINLQVGLKQFASIMLEADRLGYRVRTT